MVVIDWATIFPAFVEVAPLSIVLAIVLGLIRNVSGFFAKLKEGNGLDSYDWTRLLGTIIYYFGGILLFGMGLDIPTALTATVSFDYLTSVVKKVKK